MFHRRLALLVGVVSLGMAALTAQLVRLTVVKGAVLQQEAEKKLVTTHWSYAGRGRILDRHGRVLAQDRPSFDLAVDFPVISGAWAVDRALARAKAQNLDTWRRLGRQERQALADPYVPIYQAHVDRMWARIAAETGTDPARIAQRTADIYQRVSNLSDHMYRVRLKGVLLDRLKDGDEISGDLDEQTRRRISRPIEEERSPQVVLPKIPDEAGFRLMGLERQEVEIAIPVGGIAGGETVTEQVPLMPGMAILAAGDREYPLDAMEVDVELGSLPPPVRDLHGVGESGGRKTIRVEGVAYHILGRMKPTAQKEDSIGRQELIERDPAFARRVLVAPPSSTDTPERIDRGRYLDNDSAGLSGIESSQEAHLRGLRGLRIKQLETGHELEIPPEQGRDVRLTIDIALQARVQAAMSPSLGLAMAQDWHYREGTPQNPTVPVGTPLNGAAVVLDVDSGEILAMVSTPSIPRSTLKDDPAAVFGDQVNLQAGMPWIDRSIARPYPPGSIAKALVLTGAVKLGRLNLDVSIDCAGYLYPDKPEMFRCWAFKQFQRNHGPLLAPQALTVSCNIFFFTLGQRLGPQGITDTYAMYGLGQPWNLGVGLEYQGAIGERDNQGRRLPLGVSDATQMGIGQGPVDWTPLHAADAYTTLARGGVRITPHLLANGTPPQTTDLGLDPRSVRQAMEGLKGSVNTPEGTGHHLTIDGRYVPHFNIPGTIVWGKTGTAQAPTIFIQQTIPDPSRPGAQIPNPLWDRAADAAAIAAAAGDPSISFPSTRRALRWGDHSWFVVLVGSAAEGRPRYAIAVMMEYAGSGGKVSGPIVNQIIAALKAERYL